MKLGFLGISGLADVSVEVCKVFVSSALCLSIACLVCPCCVLGVGGTASLP